MAIYRPSRCGWVGDFEALGTNCGYLTCDLRNCKVRKHSKLLSLSSPSFLGAQNVLCVRYLILWMLHVSCVTGLELKQSTQ